MTRLTPSETPPLSIIAVMTCVITGSRDGGQGEVGGVPRGAAEELEKIKTIKR